MNSFYAPLAALVYCLVVAALVWMSAAPALTNDAGQRSVARAATAPAEAS